MGWGGVLIIDDEAPAREELKYLLNNYSEIEIVGLAKHGLDGLEKIKSLEPDLIFLDIQMPKLNGIEVAKQLLKLPKIPKIIFVTAYDEYAINAFELDAIDYLLKPIDEAELLKAVKKYEDRLPQKQAVTLDFNDIKKLLINPIDREYKKRFSVKIGQHLKLINIEEIECFYRKLRYSQRCHCL
mgnify:CR=1 FL=1